jgi:hypothetical protein
LCLLGPGLGLPALAQGQDLKTIQKELQQEFKHLRQATREAVDDAEAEAVYRDFQETVLPEFAGRFAAVARGARGSETALEAWTSVIELANQGLRGELPGEALQAITSDHLQSVALAKVANGLRYSAHALDEKALVGALRTMSERSPHREVQAMALFSLGGVLAEERAPDDPRVAEAKQAFAKLAAYGDLEYLDGRTFAEAAAAYVFALENLVVGKPCPDFSAVDAEGVAFKLSDYKGKVVLLDFWGFW